MGMAEGPGALGANPGQLPGAAPQLRKEAEAALSMGVPQL